MIVRARWIINLKTAMVLRWSGSEVLRAHCATLGVSPHTVSLYTMMRKKLSKLAGLRNHSLAIGSTGNPNELPGGKLMGFVSGLVHVEGESRVGFYCTLSNCKHWPAYLES